LVFSNNSSNQIRRKITQKYPKINQYLQGFNLALIFHSLYNPKKVIFPKYIHILNNSGGGKTSDIHFFLISFICLELSI